MAKKTLLPLAELKFQYSRSPGPGGQNVNKVNSKVLLRWDVLASNFLSAERRARLLANFKSKVTTEGELLLSSAQFRDQARNKEACLGILRSVLENISRPRKKRKKTKPSIVQKEKRLSAKKKRTQIKAFRKKQVTED